jgi:serine/threonine protein phosphatase 1
MGRTLVIGDIHGNNRGLLQCLERSGFDNEKDTLIQLGDIADGWPEVSECVDTLLGIKNLIAIRGNHDVWVYDWIKWGHIPVLWTEQGGKATMESYVRTSMFLDKHHQSFWEEQIDWHVDENNRLFIHAGWDYRYGFPEGAALTVNAGTIARECHWDRDLLMGAKAAHKFKGNFKALEQFHEVYIGHTAIMLAKPENYLNLWNLDTGSGWFGKLTIMDIDTKEYWQSDFSTLLYPEHQGRGR